MRAPPANVLFVVALLLLLGVLSFRVFLPLLTPILLGLLLAYLVHPLHRRLARGLRDRPRIAAALLLLLIVAVVVVPASFGIVRVARELSGVSPESAAAQVDAALAPVARALGYPENGTYGRDAVAAAGPIVRDWLATHAGDIVSLAASIFIGVFMLVFVFYFALVDGGRFVDWLGGTMPMPRAQFEALVANVRSTLDAVFLGQLVSALSQGVLATIGFAIFGVPLFFVWGALTVVVAVLPFVGAFAVWIPVVLWMLAVGKTMPALGLAVYCLVLVANVDNVVQPVLVGRRARVHPVLVLVGVLGGVSAFGLVGFIVGPLVLSLLVAVLNFWREDYLPAFRDAELSVPPDAGPRRE